MGYPTECGARTLDRMYTLRIEHPITEFAAWKQAFDGFAEMRRRAGVRAFAVRTPVDDAHYVHVDLDFETEEQANAFLGFLRERVWADRGASPALAGDPIARVLVVRAG